MTHDILADTVRRMVESFPADVEVVQLGVVSDRTPAAARAVLAAALSYIVEPFDLMPDRSEGIGLMDDAAIIRLAARAAVAHGAGDDGLRRLAAEAAELDHVFGDLVFALDEHLVRLQQPRVRGRTPDQIIADPESRMELWERLAKRRDSARSHAQAAATMDTAELVKEMRTVIRSRLASRKQP